MDAYRFLIRVLHRLENIEESAGEVNFDPQEALSIWHDQVNLLCSEIESVITHIESTALKNREVIP